MNQVKDVLARLSTGRALIVGVILGILYYWILYDPGTNLINSIAGNAAHIDQLQKQIQADQAKLDRAATFKKTAAEIGTTINKLLSLIPEKFSMPDLLRIVSNEAKVAGSSLATITPQSQRQDANQPPTGPFKEFEELIVSIELNGTFLQHMVFLSNLTKINQILIIRKFDFGTTREGRADEANLVKMVAEIVAFRYRGGTETKTAAGDKQ